MKSILVVTNDRHVQLSISSSEEGSQYVMLAKHEVEILAEALNRVPWSLDSPRKKNMVLLDMEVR